MFQQIGHPSFAGLAVDANDLPVFAANVIGINR